MDELRFKEIIAEAIGISVKNMEDSIFDSAYGISETDAFFLIYYLTMESKLLKQNLLGLLDLDDITFQSVYNMCN